MDRVGSKVRRGRQGGNHLEVRQRWGDLELDTRPFRDGVVSLGARPGWRWRVLGVDMGLVSPRVARILPWVLPVWSEVEEALVDDFLCYPTDDGAPWELARREGDDWWIEADEAWPVSVRDDDGERSLEALLAEGTAAREGRRLRVRVGGLVVQVTVGTMVFEVRQIADERVTDRALAGVDPVGAAAAVTCLGLGALFGAVLQLAPPPTRTAAVTVEESAVEVPLQAQEPVVRVAEPAREGKGRAAGPEKATRRPGGGDAVDPRRAGILGSSALDALASDGAIDAALADGVRGLIGSRGVGLPGGGGLRGRTGGLGGGGGVETVGVGRPGGGGGDDDGWTKGNGAGLVDRQDPVLIGALPKEAVDEVVRNHLAALRYCYQRELVKDPQLQGKVTTRFVIAKDGSVSSAEVTRSSLGNAAVDACVAGRFLRMRFPEPAGGGIVVVSYPLVFTRG